MQVVDFAEDGTFGKLLGYLPHLLPRLLQNLVGLLTTLKNQVLSFRLGDYYK
jgi:hypothetical protein